MTFRTFVPTLVLRWKLVAGAVLASLLGAAALTALQTKHYQSSATILVSFSGLNSFADLGVATEASQKLLSSYAAIAGGYTVAQRAVDEFHVPVSAGALASQTQVAYTPETTLFTITVTDTDPNRAAVLAGAMADSFTAMIPTLGTGPGALAAQATESSPTQPAPGQPPLPVARATVMGRPGVPAAPVSPTPTRNMALGLIAGVLLGVAVALTRDGVDHRIQRREQLEQLLVSPTLAELSARHGRAPRFGTESSFDDAMRGLRTRLLRKIGPEARRVLVAAPFGGEGTTTTALNLALSFVELGEKVLLIEGDIRRPVIANMMSIKSVHGLANALADCPVLPSYGSAMVNTGEAVHNTPVGNLFVLASQTARNDETLPRSAELPYVLQTLSAYFDRLVIDGPPVLATADTALLADAVEVTVLVVRAGRTTIDEVEDALHALHSTGTNVVGTVAGAWLGDQFTGFNNRVLGGVSSKTLAVDDSTLARLAEDANLNRAIAQAPVFGHGLGYAYQLPFGKPGSYTADEGTVFGHNFYLWWLAKSGAVGMAAFALFALTPLFRALRCASAPAKISAAVSVGLLFVCNVANLPEEAGSMTLGLALGPAMAFASRGRTQRSGAEQTPALTGAAR